MQTRKLLKRSTRPLQSSLLYCGTGVSILLALILLELIIIYSLPQSSLCTLNQKNQDTEPPMDANIANQGKYIGLKQNMGGNYSTKVMVPDIIVNNGKNMKKTCVYSL